MAGGPLSALDIETKFVAPLNWANHKSIGNFLSNGTNNCQRRCDIVYTNTTVIAAGALAACFARKPHVWHSHESGYHNHNLKFDLGHRWVA